MTDADDLRRLAAALAAEARPGLTFMEVCGTHTMSIARYGLRQLLPDGMRLVSGPGCPVCVTAMGDLDRVVALARRPEVALVTFGDLVRVPASRTSLAAVRAAGADVRVVYSPRDAVEIAAAEPGRQVVFAGIGFETTAPTIAAALLEARARGIANFSVLSLHKTMPLPLRALLELGETPISGFLLPGHVSVVTGTGCYAFLASEYGVSGVVAGFEPRDILEALLLLVRQTQPAVSIQYTRAVRPEGNLVAQRLLEEVFVPADADWRGLGVIPGSGLALRDEFAELDAARRFPVDLPPALEPSGCRCGEVLRGVTDPADCTLFGVRCTPEDPVGACMVSSEGACAARYRYRGSMSSEHHDTRRVLLGHGSGGKLYRDLVKEVFVTAFANPVLERLDDAAALATSGRIAFTTDSHVVQPLRFAGGDIGRLAVAGTVNDLATAAARPLALAAAFIIEEGFALDELRDLCASAAATAREAGVPIVTGDTKVVERGACDGLYVTTTGVGEIVVAHELGAAAVREGDAVIVSGSVGDHAVAVLAARGEFKFSASVESDCAPLWGLVEAAVSAARAAGGEEAVRFLRDPTRGGLTTVLAELAEEARLGIEVEEEAIPVSPAVRSVCDLLGYDALTLANEGKMVLAVAPDAADAVVAAVRETEYGRDARRIGFVTAAHPGRVALRTPFGTRRVLDMPVGELLPRIC